MYPPPTQFETRKLEIEGELRLLAVDRRPAIVVSLATAWRRLRPRPATQCAAEPA